MTLDKAEIVTRATWARDGLAAKGFFPELLSISQCGFMILIPMKKQALDEVLVDLFTKWPETHHVDLRGAPNGTIIVVAWGCEGGEGWSHPS